MTDALKLKDLVKLAKICRTAGIDAFEGYGVKFTLYHQPTHQAKQPKISPNQPDAGPNTIDSEELSDEALLMWSTTPPPEDTGSQ